MAVVNVPAKWNTNDLSCQLARAGRGKGGMGIIVSGGGIVLKSPFLLQGSKTAPALKSWSQPRRGMYWEGLSTARHGQITAKSLPPPVSRRRVLSGLLIGRRAVLNTAKTLPAGRRGQ